MEKPVKNRIIIIIVILALAALIVFNIFCDRPFGKYDFSKGGYYLLCRGHEGTEDLYTDDVKVLEQIKNRWVFIRPSPYFACGFDYTVELCRGGESLAWVDINLSCNEIVTHKGTYYFDQNLLLEHMKTLKKPVLDTKKFKTLEDMREYRTKILKEKNLILVEAPEGLKYDGEFEFSCPEVNCGKDENAVLSKLRREIQDAFPGEVFELECKGNSSWKGQETSIIGIRCYRALEKRFNLYNYKKKNDGAGWKAYMLSLDTFWEKPANQ